MKDEFIYLLKNTKRENIDKLIEWLEKETDFFSAPASTKYHLNYEGGLLVHSLNVFRELMKEYNPRNKKEISSVVIVSLLHVIISLFGKVIDLIPSFNCTAVKFIVVYGVSLLMLNL